VSAVKRLRACTWPKCRRRQQFHLWCWSHWSALGPDLQLKFLHSAPADREKVIAECHSHALATIEWRKTHVTGGSLANPNP